MSPDRECCTYCGIVIIILLLLLLTVSTSAFADPPDRWQGPRGDWHWRGQQQQQSGWNWGQVGGTAVGTAGGQVLGGVIQRWIFGPPAPPPAPVVVAPAPVVVQPAPIYVVPPVRSPSWYAYCASKYKSFDPATGTYLGYDGIRHACQ